MPHKTYEAVIDQHGRVILTQSVDCAPSSRALVIVLDGELASREGPTRSTTTTDDGKPSGAIGDDRTLSPLWARRYKVVRDLAHGMARVTLAERMNDGKLICLKFLYSDTDRRILGQECRALLRLRHPSIVSIVDFSSEETPPWLATEYLTGSTLRQHLKANGALNSTSVVRILTTISDALAYAHSQGVIHRDLKPSNIIVDAGPKDIQVQLLDFGLALLDDYDHAGIPTAVSSPLVGTLPYMAPEQLEGLSLTPACDLYALGLIGLEMLSGHPVFESTSSIAVIVEKLRPLNAKQILRSTANVPDALVAFLESTTARDPASRPTARAALEMLKPISAE